jgi:hypothetical protein
MTPQEEAAYENVTSDILKQMSFNEWMMKMENI